LWGEAKKKKPVNILRGEECSQYLQWQVCNNKKEKVKGGSQRQGKSGRGGPNLRRGKGKRERRTRDTKKLVSIKKKKGD